MAFLPCASFEHLRIPKHPVLSHTFGTYLTSVESRPAHISHTNGGVSKFQLIRCTLVARP